MQRYSDGRSPVSDEEAELILTWNKGGGMDLGGDTEIWKFTRGVNGTVDLK